MVFCIFMLSALALMCAAEEAYKKLTRFIQYRLSCYRFKKAAEARRPHSRII